MEFRTFIIISLASISYNLSAQTSKDSVTIKGIVTDYNGKPIDDCSLTWQNENFDVITGLETKTNNKGEYSIRIPKGKYSNMGAINMDTYPHTMRSDTKDEDLRLEFWGWNFIADRDTILNIRYHRMEVYGLHAFHISGGMPTFQIFMRPMSLTRFLANKRIKDAQHKESLNNIIQKNILNEAKCDNMAPTIDKVHAKVWIDGEEVTILMKQEIKEYFEATEYGIAYLLTVDYPKNHPSLPYHVFKVELTDLENGDKGEAIYYLEKERYADS